MNTKWFLSLLSLMFDEDLGNGLGDIGDVSGGKNDDLNVMNDDNTEEEEIEEEQTEENPEEEQEEENENTEEEEEHEEEESEEEEEEESDEDRRLTHYSDIKKSYPDFFKKFPDVKAALFRDERYSEIFGNPQEAEQAASKANVLDQIDNDVVKNGDPTALLGTIKKNNPEAFTKVVSRIQSYVAENDRELYLRIAAVPIKQLLRSAFKEGKGKETDLGRAAQYIHHYFFNDTNIDGKVEFEDIKKETKSEKELQLERKLQEINDREYSTFKTSVDASYIKRMSDTIKDGLDKDARLNDYTKNKLVEDILVDIKKTLENDRRYLNSVNAIWRQAEANGYSNDFKSRIVNAALARAKSLVPEVRKRLVAEALGKKNNSDKKASGEKKVVSMSGRKPASSGNKKPQEKKPLTDLDILRGA